MIMSLFDICSFVLFLLGTVLEAYFLKGNQHKQLQSVLTLGL